MKLGSKKNCYRLLIIEKIPIYVHFSYIVITTIIAMTFLFQDITTALFISNLFLCVFLSVLIHELGHAYVAKKLCHDVNSITLYPVGGIALITIVNQKKYDLLKIALAGPTANLISALIIIICSGFTLNALSLMNILLGVSNILPIRSLDGGIVFREICALKLGHKKADQLLYGLTVTIIIAILALSLYFGSIALCLVSLFIFIYGIITHDDSIA
jgi:Zn-dependent protease